MERPRSGAGAVFVGKLKFEPNQEASKACLEPYQTFKMKLFGKIVNG